MTFRLSDLYPLGRPLLFQLDAEHAHEVTLSVIERGQNTPLQCAWAQPLVNDPITLAGLKFGNRVGLAAGLDKNGRCIDGFGAMGFGSIEVGTVTPKAQQGNPRPRIFRLPEQNALINRLGFNNEGLDAFLRNVQGAHSFRARGGILGLNVGKNAATPIESAASDYVLCLQAVYAHADYICINISSPNTKNLRTLQSDEALDALLGTIEDTRRALADQHGIRKPVFLKIAPDLDAEQIKAVTLLLARHRIDGVVATNTTIARNKVQHLPHGSETGGLSGGPVLDASNTVIRALRMELGPDYPIIGVGGITDAESAISKLNAGASIVQIYTGLIYKGPTLIREVARAIAKVS